MFHVVIDYWSRANDSGTATEDWTIKTLPRAPKGVINIFLESKTLKEIYSYSLMMMHDVVQLELIPQGGTREPEGFLRLRQCHGEESQGCCYGDRREAERGGDKDKNSGGGTGTRGPGVEEGDRWTRSGNSRHCRTKRRRGGSSPGEAVNAVLWFGSRAVIVIYTGLLSCRTQFPPCASLRWKTGPRLLWKLTLVSGSPGERCQTYGKRSKWKSTDSPNLVSKTTFIIHWLNISEVNVIFHFPGRTQETREIHR